MLKPSIQPLLARALKSDGIYHFRRGPLVGQQRLFLIAGCHGNEIAGPLALQKLMQDEWRWPNVEMRAVFQDPEGFKEEGYGFVGVDGNESMWPPLWDFRMNKELYWFYVDENSAWGNNVVQTPRHLKMKELMAELKPTFCLSLTLFTGSRACACSEGFIGYAPNHDQFLVLCIIPMETLRLLP